MAPHPLVDVPAPEGTGGRGGAAGAVGTQAPAGGSALDDGSAAAHRPLDRVPLPGLVLRSPAGPAWSTRVDPRAVLVTLVLLVATLAVLVSSLTVGDYPLPVADVVRSLLGDQEGGSHFIVWTLRLPRGLTAVLVGAAFGASGAIFQRLVRNPLASPDIVGVNAGAALAAAWMVIIAGRSGLPVTAAAVTGAVLAAAAVYGLAYRRGLAGYRLVLVGIGVSAFLMAGTEYLLTRGEIYEVQRAVVWLTGSLNGRSWDHVRPVSWALAVLLPAALVLARQLRLLELGDDLARSLGGRVEQTRALLLLVGVGLAATATAAAGPVTFVALAAPQIARRLVGRSTLGLLPAAACGALLLVAADLVGRRLFAPTELPVGVITGVVGAPYLLYLLARSNRVGTGG
ncbi:MAG TPA: iron chelate uptake ABC transporter family permease subunit [Acidimicrobiales bacterium]